VIVALVPQQLCGKSREFISKVLGRDEGRNSELGLTADPPW